MRMFCLTMAVALFPAPAQPQTTVNPSARQSKASDFAPVQLPPLDPSLLQSTVSITRPAPVKPVIELQYDATSVPFSYPLDPKLIRWITVKNDGGYTELEFDATISGPGGFSIVGNQLGVPPLPQPGYLYLQPGESQRIWVTANWSELNPAPWTAGSTYDYRIDINVYPKLVPGQANPDPTQTQVATLHNAVSVLYLPAGGNTAGVPQTATIGGTVFDAATQKPIANASVSLVMVTLAMGQTSTVTDATGAFSLSVAAFEMAQKGMWSDFGVTIQAPGYADFHSAVAPRVGDNIRIAAAMTKAPGALTYAVGAQFETVLNLNRAEASADGQYIGIVQFHSAIPSGVDAQTYGSQAKLWFFNAGGTALWQFPLYGQTPAVAVSDDGSLVATARPDISRSDCGVYLLDRTGQTLWYIDPVSAPSLRNPNGDVVNTIWEVRISHDNRYLAAGDGMGNLYLWDIASQKLLWQRFLNGQVRVIEFESGNATIYASSGDGYLYSFTADGTANWRTYAGAWSLAFSLSKSYILISGKEGYFAALIDKATGQVVWEYPVADTPEFGAIATDESYLVIGGNADNLGTHMLDRNGVLLYHDVGSDPSFITADSANILSAGWIMPPKTAGGALWLKVLDRSGAQLWNANLGTSSQSGPGGYLWMSNDKKKIVVAAGSLVYFLNQVPNPTLTASPSAISLNLVPGGTCASQTVSISRTSPASGLAWSATANVSTNPSWLSLGATSGSTPSSPSITCMAGGMKPGSYQATVQFAAGAATAQVSVTLTVVGAEIDSVLSAASGDARLAPGQIVSIYGRGLATSSGTPSGAGAVLFNGTSIAVTDAAHVSRPAALFYVSPAQINAMIPEGTAVGAATLTVNGQSGALGSTQIAVSAIAPALFLMGYAPNAPVAALAFYYSLAGQTTGQASVFQCDAAGNCAAVPLDISGGDQLILWTYGTGIHHGNTVTCRIGGIAATVLGFAMTQYPGEDQVNVVVPRSLAGSGDQQIVLTVDGVASNAAHIDFK